MIRLRPSGADEVLIKRVRDWYEPGPGVFIAPQALFSPAQLFTGSTNGVWYDPSDLNTLFQDAAGTTPVTAVEQPVGLMLDKSKGLVLGSEVVVNGDFASSANWTTGSGWTISGGVANAASAANLVQAGILTVGRWYQASIDVTAYTAGPVYAGTLSNLKTLPTGTGTKTFRFLADATSFYVSGLTGFTGTIDNISVRELPGNHAFNASGNSANFPVLSARYNLLTNTGFSGAVAGTPGTAPTSWTLSQSAGSTTSITSNVLSVSVVSGRQLFTQPVNVTANTVYKFTCKINANSGISLYEIAYPTVNVSSTVQIYVNGVLVSDPQQSFPTANSDVLYIVTIGATSGVMTLRMGAGAFNAVTGSVSFSLPDFRLGNDALNQPDYQRVNTATDYDTVGFKPYLKFNGTNQWLQTNSIDFTYGDKMFVCAGVRKLSDAAAGIAVELSANATSGNPGAFALTAPPNILGTFAFRSGGTTSGLAYIAGYAAPITEVLSGLGDISGDQAVLRINSTQAATDTADQGTGNYGNYAMYLGARAGSSLWFNGRLHQLIVAGKQASASEITNTEAFINTKTGAY